MLNPTPRPVSAPLTLITATLTLIDHPNPTLIRLAQQTSIQGI